MATALISNKPKNGINSRERFSASINSAFLRRKFTVKEASRSPRSADPKAEELRMATFPLPASR